MIELTRFNGDRFILNTDQIEMVECTPDTVISLLTGKKVLVKESVAEVVERALEYARRIHHIAVPQPEGWAEESGPSVAGVESLEE